MSNKQLFIGCFASFCILLMSCSDCEETIVERDPSGFEAPTETEFNQLQQNAFNSSIQTQDFSADEGITFTSAYGVVLTINAGCLTLNGQLATGIATLEFSEFYDRGNMLTANAATVGLNANGDLQQLVSGGEFFIRAVQDGEELTLNCFTNIRVPTSLTGQPDEQMQPFDGVVNADGSVTWIRQNREFFIDTNAQGDSVYSTFIENFGWFNCDRFANFPDPKTELQIAIPQEFNSANSAVYLALQGEPNSLAYIYGTFPIGLQAHIIFVSEENEKFRYAVESLTIQENQRVIFTLQETQVVSEEELISILNNLP